MFARLKNYAVLMRLNKPIGIFLLLWPTLWALWIASNGNPDPLVLAVFISGVVLMRSAGCVINDYADRNIDPEVERTALRPIPAGLVRPGEALGLFVLLSLVAFGLVCLTNTLTIILSVAGAVLAAVYPFMKRHTYLPQAFLGLAFGWAIPMAFAAQTDTLPKIAWLLLIANVLWTTAYDTMYAMVDRPDDLRIGVKSTAILFGPFDTLIIAVLQATFIVVMLLIGHQLKLGLYYDLGLGAAAVFALYQQFLLYRRSETQYFKAFLNNNWLGAAVFAGIAAEYYFK
ncbi:MAG: 4-hydroxybenzoate octaprenyltransferase [Gammaproteobacteria bacterium]|nr:4-hydroxybenzoate octaprenyltransferase [Gammaproteobacteria bacterium]